MSESVRLVAEAADRLFASECAAARDALRRGEWPARLWDAFAASGLARAALPEEAGGAGFAAGLAVLRAAGRHAAPLPVAETVIGQRLCAAAGIAAPDGPLAVAATRADGAEAGPLRRVPWARFAAAVATTGMTTTEVAAVAPGRGLALVAPSVAAEGANLAGEPRDDVVFEGASAVFHALPAGVDGVALMALARAAQLRGAMERVLAMSLRHAGERRQFGRPLARFQAIQHHLAALAGEVAASGAAVDMAGQARTAFACAAAKARASQAAGEVARLAHQVHGAIGFTAEHPLHHWSKRLWAWRDEWGNEAHWWGVLGTCVARRGGDALWPVLVASGGAEGAGEEGR